jgi:Tetratricopeptide repeat.
VRVLSLILAGSLISGGLTGALAAGSRDPRWERAIKLYEAREFKAAEEHFRQILKVRAKDPDARLYLARTLMEQGRVPEALAEIESVLASAQDAETRFRIGEILRELGERRLARLQAIAPNSAAVKEMSGNELARRGRLAEALAMYRAAQQLQPARPGLHYRIGEILWRQRELDSAEAELIAELKRTPHHSMANLRLGQVLLAKDQADKALPYLEQAVRAMPEAYDARRELGKAYRKVNRLEDARREWEVVANGRPEDDQVHYLLGRLYHEQGKTVEAERELKKHATILNKRRASAGMQ